MAGQVAVKMERNGWIWAVSLKVDLEGLADGVHVGSVGRETVSMAKLFSLNNWVLWSDLSKT